MKENVLIIDADYILIENRGVVRLFCKNEKGEIILVLDSTFEPYFYAMPKKEKASKLKKKIEKLDTKRLKTKILKVEVIKRKWKNKKTKLIKITVDNPRRVPDVRNLIKEWTEVEETYEYDIPFYKRYIIDKQIEPTNWSLVEGNEIKNIENYQVNKVIEATSVKPIKLRKEVKFKTLVFDTEFIEENGESKLIMLSLVSNYGYKKVLSSQAWKKKPSWVEVVKGEKEIIERFLEIVREINPDFLCSYNGDNFDFPKIKERAGELKVSLKLGRDDSSIRVVRRGRISSAKIKGRVHIDLFNFINHILAASMRSEVLTLDEVAQELVGTGKKEMKYKEMVELWRKKEQLERLVEYSLNDSILTLKLAELILPQIFSLCKLTGLLPFDVCRNTYSQLLEGFYIKRAFIDNTLVPNRPKTEEIEKRRMIARYKGAIVVEPTKGIHSDILVFDFRSLYPTIMVSHNIDPWTLNCEHKECKEKNKVPETKWYFCTKVKGFIPKHLADLIERRKKVKEEMKKLKKDSKEWKRLDNEQFSLKILANASYGYTGYIAAKWYSRKCARSTAALGRMYIKKIIELAKKEGFNVIYGDTDSVFLKVSNKKGLIKKAEEFIEKVNKKLPGIIELEFRDLYEGGIFVARKGKEVGAKKRYALIDYQGNLEIRGFETVRRDWCQLSKDIQRKMLTIILKNRDPAKAIQLVRDTIKKIKGRKVSLDELTIFEQITRPLSQYEQIGPHVKAAQKAKSRGRAVGEGTVIGFVITKGVGSISERAEPVEDVKPNQYDPKYYIEHQILPASMRVLKALGYTEQEVLTGKVQKKLGGYFK